MERILVIDDNAQVLATLRKMLEREGHEIVVALDGNEGLKLYREKPTDLIITDIIMPGKGGVETIAEIHRDFPDAKIIAISGGGRVDARAHLSVVRQFGIQYAFAKPVERKELLRAVRELFW